MDQNRGVPDGTESTSASGSGTSNTTNTGSGGNVTNSFMGSWKPNDSYMITLTSMGFTTIQAKKALYFTNNESAEAAIEWIFSNGNDDSDLPLEMELENPQTQSSSRTYDLIQTSSDSGDDLYKMVFVVNSELNMGVGKIAAQVAHAALGLNRLLLLHESKYAEQLIKWMEYGETKIVLRGENTNHLVKLENETIALDLPCYVVHDAGKTQVKSGSATVLGIFGSNKLVDQVTRQLKLY